jgi:hypothetical protein
LSPGAICGSRFAAVFFAACGWGAVCAYNAAIAKLNAKTRGADRFMILFAYHHRPPAVKSRHFTTKAQRARRAQRMPLWSLCLLGRFVVKALPEAAARATVGRMDVALAAQTQCLAVATVLDIQYRMYIHIGG